MPELIWPTLHQTDRPRPLPPSLRAVEYMRNRKRRGHDLICRRIAHADASGARPRRARTLSMENPKQSNFALWNGMIRGATSPRINRFVGMVEGV